DLLAHFQRRRQLPLLLHGARPGHDRHDQRHPVTRDSRQSRSSAPVPLWPPVRAAFLLSTVAGDRRRMRVRHPTWALLVLLLVPSGPVAAFAEIVTLPAAASV